FLGERDKAWMLDRYNHVKEKPVHRGDVVLVPLSDLELTADGKAEAASAGALVRAEGLGRTRDAQLRAEAELPQIATDVRMGRYVDGIARCNKLLGSGELARPQRAAIERSLVESYAALDATGLAERACTAWREAEPDAALDPIELSPKIIKACSHAEAPRPEAPPDAGAPDATRAEPHVPPPLERSRAGRRDGGR